MTRDDLIKKVKAKRRALEIAKESNAFSKCIWIEGQIHALEMLIITWQKPVKTRKQPNAND